MKSNIIIYKYIIYNIKYINYNIYITNNQKIKSYFIIYKL